MPSRRPKPCRTPGPSFTWKTLRLSAALATGTNSCWVFWEWLRLLSHLLDGVRVPQTLQYEKYLCSKCESLKNLDSGLWELVNSCLQTMQLHHWADRVLFWLMLSVCNESLLALAINVGWMGFGLVKRKKKEFLCFVSACYITWQAHWEGQQWQWAGPSGAGILPCCSFMVC